MSEPYWNTLFAANAASTQKTGIGEVFNTFCDNLKIGNVSDISYRYKRITNQLNVDFWGYESQTAHSIYSGSYGRDTAISGLSDLDMVFWLPPSYKSTYDSYTYNGQSGMLQAVKRSIQKTYPSTEVGGDGQVVAVSFYDGMTFEVVPGFETSDGGFTYPDSNDGGKWKYTNPRPEQNAINALHSLRNQNLKRLCRMMRAWKRGWTVPIKGLLIDTLAYNFLSARAEYNSQSYYYYDWLSRDFFRYLAEQSSEQQYWYAPGSNQFVWRAGNFEYKAKQCYNLALEAIQADSAGYQYTRNKKWREIYGTSFPS